MIYKFKYILFLVFIATVFFSSCSKDKDVPSSESKQPIEVTLVYASGSLGDRGYNDNIYRGVQKSAIKYDFRTHTYLIDDLIEARMIIKYWIEQAAPNKRRLLILCASNYAQYLSEFPQWDNKGNDNVLILDSEQLAVPAYIINMPLYGASYIAGKLTTDMLEENQKPAIVMANPYDKPILYAKDGFIAGYNRPIDSQDLFYLSTTARGGYEMDDSLYRLSFELNKKYKFTFPVAGGSLHGLLNYLREWREQDIMLTCGMDSDRSEECGQALFSIVKKVDAVVEEFIIQWISKQVIPQYQSKGLESRYVDVVSSYDIFKQKIEANRAEALEKERVYFLKKI